MNPWDRNMDQNCNHQNSNKVGPTPHKLNPWDRSKDQNLRTQIAWKITQDGIGRPKGNIWETPYRKPRHVPRRPNRGQVTSEKGGKKSDTTPSN